MYAALFKNKWPLVAFAVLVLAGAQYFASRESEGGTLIANEDRELAARPSGVAPATDDAVDEEPASELDGFYDDAETEFLADEELIDSTEGFDPTPVEDEASEDEDSDAEFDQESSEGVAE